MFMKVLISELDILHDFFLIYIETIVAMASVSFRLNIPVKIILGTVFKYIKGECWTNCTNFCRWLKYAQESLRLKLEKGI